MSKVIASITTSVDGYVTGPDDGPEYGLGIGGERLHNWVMGGPWTYEGEHAFAMSAGGPGVLRRVRRQHGLRASSAVGCTTPPGRGAAPTRSAAPCTSSPTARRTRPIPSTGFRFVDGFEPRHGAGPEAAGEQDVAVGGGADVIRQALAGGYVDVLAISTAPVILGRGKRLFEGFDHDLDLEKVSVHSSQWATHMTYAVKR